MTDRTNDADPVERDLLLEESEALHREATEALRAARLVVPKGPAS